MWSPSPLAEAVTYGSLASALIGIGAAFPARTSPLRWMLLLPHGLLIYSMSKIPTRTSPMVDNFVGGALLLLPLQYLEAVLLNRWDFTAQGPTSALGGLRPATKVSKRGANDNLWNRLCFAGQISCHNRYVATPWPVKAIPEFDYSRPGYVPSRARFLWKMTYELLVLLLVLDVNAYAPRDPNHELLFSKARMPLFSRLSEVTVEEMGIRVVGVFTYCFFGWVVLETLYHALAIVHVACGLASPHDYPPLVGQLKELYSIRQFWGKFWHKVFQRKLCAPAYFITYELLGQRRDSVVARHLYIFLAFFVSGVVHAVGDMHSGFTFRESGAMMFFCMQPIGIMIEAGIVALWSAVTGRRYRTPPLWAKLLGFVWFCAWMIWLGPFWMWNMIRVSKPGILPFSLIGLFLK